MSRVLANYCIVMLGGIVFGFSLHAAVVRWQAAQLAAETRIPPAVQEYLDHARRCIHVEGDPEACYNPPDNVAVGSSALDIKAVADNSIAVNAICIGAGCAPTELACQLADTTEMQLWCAKTHVPPYEHCRLTDPPQFPIDCPTHEDSQ